MKSSSYQAAQRSVRFPFSTDFLKIGIFLLRCRNRFHRYYLPLRKLPNVLVRELRFAGSFGFFLKFLFMARIERSLNAILLRILLFACSQKSINRNYDIYTDNSLDISCNKLSALFDRSEAKDFVDIFFIVPRMVKPITKEELREFFHSSAKKLMKP